MVECFAIKNSLTVDTNGDIKPCCKFKGKFGNLYKDLINTKVFETLLNDEWPSGCINCKLAENKNLRSRRISYENRFNKQDFLLDLSIGNYCNLKCRMCNEKLSTGWYADAKKLGCNTPPPSQLTLEHIDNVFESLPQDKNIIIELKGGEPLLLPTTEYVFKKAIKMNATIICITNGTVLPEWFFEIIKYKKLQLQLSVDGIENTYNYVRGDKNFTWETCLDRIKYFENLDIDFSYNYVVQNLTINDMLEFESMVCRRINWIILNNPNYLSCHIVPDENKFTILEKLNKLISCPSGLKENFLRDCDLTLYKQFIEHTRKLDKIRTQSLKIICPFLLNKYGIEIYDSI